MKKCGIRGCVDGEVDCSATCTSYFQEIIRVKYSVADCAENEFPSNLLHKTGDEAELPTEREVVSSC